LLEPHCSAFHFLLTRAYVALLTDGARWTCLNAFIFSKGGGEDETVKTPGILTGAWVGLLLTAPLVALFYLEQRLLGLPFVPFDLFDWLARLLPGALITAVIDVMVRILSALPVGELSDAAKAAEQGMAIASFLLVGALAGGIFFALSRRPAGWPAGLLLGALVGVPLLIISARVNETAATPPALSGLGILLTFLGWGLALSWVQRRLASPTKAGVSAELLNRRQFLVRVGGAAALITVVGAGVAASLGARREEEMLEAGELWSSENLLPNAAAPTEPVPGTRPEFTPLARHYRIDINLTPPVLREDAWRLRVGGLVDAPTEMTLAELRAYEPLHQFVTLSCISNQIGGDLIGTQRWTGVPLRRLLPEWGVREEATHLRIVSADGFFEYVALEDVRSDERIMLTYAWDGVPLRIKHGFPLRIYIPNLYGMKQPKWIEEVEAVSEWEPGYWVRRGWDREAVMKTTSFIDTVAVNMLSVDAQGGEVLPIGGFAHAGARGISKVEVQVDGGEWQEAELRRPISETTWTLWRFDWPFEPGEHTFTVRCFDGEGTPQIVDPAPPHPSGATGLDRERVRV